jgi:hypothetical protein
MNIIIYKLSSGQVLRLCQCPDDLAQAQLAVGEGYVKGTLDSFSYYIQDGEVVDMPPKPGEFYVFDYGTKQWVPDPTAADAAARAQRNALLTESDWTQMPDVTLDTKTQWATYRQDLRDVTDQPGYPFDIVWPTPPTA